MKRWIAVLLGILLILPALPYAQAAEGVPEHDGYLFQVKPDADRINLLEIPEGIEAVRPQEGLYLADHIATIETYVDLDQVIVEPNYIVTLFDTVNDPLYQNDLQWSAAMLGQSTAWALGLDGTGVRIGIVDSGCNVSHEDFQGAAIFPGYDYVENDEFPQDTVGHGTFVAGIIAAQSNNGRGIAGLAPGVEIVPLKCFSGRTTTLALVVEALYGGIDDYQCDIINMSLGVPQDSGILKAAVDRAEAEGIIIIAAVGNDGQTSTVVDVLNYPAAYPSVIGVGAIDRNEKLGYFSQKNESVFVVAPGVDMCSLGIESDTSYKSGGNGTSYAAPCVTGIAALLKQHNPGLTSALLMEQLKSSARDLGPVGWDSNFGHGSVYMPALFEVWAPGLQVMRRDNDSIQLRARFQVDGAERTALAVIAAYSAQGKLLATEQTVASIQDGKADTGILTLPIPGAVRMKAFLLDPVSLSPLSSAQEILLS